MRWIIYRYNCKSTVVLIQETKTEFEDIYMIEMQWRMDKCNWHLHVFIKSKFKRNKNWIWKGALKLIVIYNPNSISYYLYF